MSFLEALGRVLLGLLGALGVGAAVSRPFTHGLTRLEKSAWSLAAGLLVQAACLLLLLALGLTPGAFPLLLAEAVVAAGALRFGLAAPRGGPSPPAPNGSRTVVAVLAGVAVVGWLLFLVGSLADPMWATDFVAFWGYKGKVVFLTGDVPGRLFQDPALYFAHKEYPLLVPLTLTALASFVGQWNDQALALFYPVCEGLTLLAIFGFLRRRVSSLAGATAAALASVCFFLYRPANAGTAEVPFALALVLLVSAALDSLTLSRNAAAVTGRLALASLFCATLKQEGTLFVSLTAVTLFLNLRTSNRAAGKRAVFALLTPAFAHWIALYLLRGNQTRRDFDFTLFLPSRWPELPPIFASVVGRMLGTEGRNVFPAIVAILVFFVATKRGIGDPLLPVFAVQMLFYAVAFTVSSFDPMYAIDGAFRRITMSLFPAFAMVLGARLGSLFDTAGAPVSSPAGQRAWPDSDPEAVL